MPLSDTGKSACTAGATATLAGAMAQPPLFPPPPYFQYSPVPIAAASTHTPAAHAPAFTVMMLSPFIKECALIICESLG